jgi:hypothetical protein
MLGDDDDDDGQFVNKAMYDCDIGGFKLDNSTVEASAQMDNLYTELIF